MEKNGLTQAWQCWSCKTLLERCAYRCDTCNLVQPPDPSVNHFQRFGFEQLFALDLEKLSKAFRSNQRLMHPDRFASATPKERRHALEHSTILNDGYRVLKDPISRAAYMLSLLNLDVTDDRSIRLSPQFLVTILEVRESLEELTGPDAHVERKRIKQSVALEYEESLARLGSRLDSVSKHTQDRVLAMGQLYGELKYLRRILEEIERLEAEGDTPNTGNGGRLDPLRSDTFERKGT